MIPGVRYLSLVAFVLITSSVNPTAFLQVHVTDHAVSSFAVRDSGSVVAVGAADGSCHVLSLSSGLYELAPNEKAAINAMFERETARSGRRHRQEMGDQRLFRRGSL